MKGFGYTTTIKEGQYQPNVKKKSLWFFALIFICLHNYKWTQLKTICLTFFLYIYEWILKVP